MSEDIQSYLIPGLVLGYLMWKFFKFRRIKAQMPALVQSGAVIVDVRTTGEYKMGSRPGSINIPLDQLSDRLHELKKDQQIVLCCASGARSGMAVGILKKNGFENVVNAGPWVNTVI